MTDQERQYVRYLLNRIKRLYAEGEAIKALIRTSDLPDPYQFVRDLEERSAELLARPEIQHELDATFAGRFEEIELGLDQIEALEELLKSPIKGLPN